jgi:hypothetical protein
MALHTAFFGTAIKDCEAKESKNGTRYANILVATSNGNDAEGAEERLIVKLAIFGDLIEEAVQIRRDDRLYCEGTATVSVFLSQKGPRPSVNIVAHHLRRPRIGEMRPKFALVKDYQPPQPDATHFASALTAETAPAFLSRPPDILAHRREKPLVMGRDDPNDQLPF